MMVSPIEVEVLKVTQAKPHDETETRQTYLARLAVMVAQIDESVFDSMSQRSQDWGNSAIDAINNSKDLPEFTDPTAEEAKVVQMKEVAKTSTPKTKRSAGSSKDRYGYRIGSKTSEVLVAFEKGAKMAEIKERFGSPHYNVLKSLEVAGHRITRNGGTVTLHHKDDA